MKISDLLRAIQTKGTTSFYCPFNQTRYYIADTQIITNGLVILTDQYKYRRKMFDNVESFKSLLESIMYTTNDRTIKFELYRTSGIRSTIHFTIHFSMTLKDLVDLLKLFPEHDNLRFYCPQYKKYYYVDKTCIRYDGSIHLTDNIIERSSLFITYKSAVRHLNKMIPPYGYHTIKIQVKNQEFEIR